MRKDLLILYSGAIAKYAKRSLNLVFCDNGNDNESESALQFDMLFTTGSSRIGCSAPKMRTECLISLAFWSKNKNWCFYNLSCIQKLTKTELKKMFLWKEASILGLLPFYSYMYIVLHIINLFKMVYWVTLLESFLVWWLTCIGRRVHISLGLTAPLN